MMEVRNQEQIFCEEVKNELERDILPYWMNRMIDSENGGFYGRITGQEELLPMSSKGAILNARILWTFSAAYRLLKKDCYLNVATRAKRYILDYFYDNECGGIYWELDYTGEPLNTKKQIYAISFVIYGLSEYTRATGDEEALQYAKSLFKDIELHSFDNRLNGYVEALARDWSPLADVRLSEKDENEKKTMNTHLHILEAYTNLYRVWQDDFLKKQLKNLIELFITHIWNRETSHLNLFFDDNWQSTCDVFSYGHDIEASWLLHEAALVLNDSALLTQVETIIVQLASAADEGINADGSLSYEYSPKAGKTDMERHWWVQAENVVGHINLYLHFSDNNALNKAIKCWQFIQNHLIDKQHGEWFWSCLEDGSANRLDDKAGFWKCPYHNGRMCMEIIERYAL